MRRKDREIQNYAEIIDVLKRCDTLSIGFHGEEYPYVVPVSFGVSQNDSALIIYFHGAKQGHKIDMIRSNAKVCVEGHIFYKVEPTQVGIATRYESVIGFGHVEAADENEVIPALRSITEHYHYPIDRCKGLQMTTVYKIRIEKLTGKRSL